MRIKNGGVSSCHYISALLYHADDMVSRCFLEKSGDRPGYFFARRAKRRLSGMDSRPVNGKLLNGLQKVLDLFIKCYVSLIGNKVIPFNNRQFRIPYMFGDLSCMGFPNQIIAAANHKSRGRYF